MASMTLRTARLPAYLIGFVLTDGVFLPMTDTIDGRDCGCVVELSRQEAHSTIARMQQQWRRLRQQLPAPVRARITGLAAQPYDSWDAIRDAVKALPSAPRGFYYGYRLLPEGQAAGTFVAWEKIYKAGVG
jgi:hypothetical protein